MLKKWMVTCGASVSPALRGWKCKDSKFKLIWVTPGDTVSNKTKRKQKAKAKPNKTIILGLHIFVIKLFDELIHKCNTYWPFSRLSYGPTASPCICVSFLSLTRSSQCLWVESLEVEPVGWAVGTKVERMICPLLGTINSSAGKMMAGELFSLTDSWAGSVWAQCSGHSCALMIATTVSNLQNGCLLFKSGSCYIAQVGCELRIILLYQLLVHHHAWLAKNSRT